MTNTLSHLEEELDDFLYAEYGRRLHINCLGSGLKTAKEILAFIEARIFAWVGKEESPEFYEAFRVWLNDMPETVSDKPPICIDSYGSGNNAFKDGE